MCKCNGCDCLSVIFSVVVGIIIAILFYVTLIPRMLTALWITLGVAAFVIAIMVPIILFANTCAKPCVCENGKCLVTGALGTLIASIISLAVTLVTGSIPIAIIIFLVGTFFTLMMISLFRMLYCLVCSTCA